MDLIKTLVSEHETINEIFDAIDAASDLENKKILIQKLLSVAGDHFKKEDEQLYPVLQASPDIEVREMASIFSLTMGGYAKEFIAVTDEIMASNEEISATLATNYEKIRDKIKDRVVIEEVTIFPAYENLSE